MSVLDKASVYQYSALSNTWEVFIENQIIDYATKTSAGVVQIGDGIDVTIDGVISINTDDVATANWDQNDVDGDGYIKNRTHYTGKETRKTGLIDSLLLDDTLYPKIKSYDNEERRASGIAGLADMNTYLVKISDDTPSIEELQASPDAYWIAEYFYLNADGSDNYKSIKVYYKNTKQAYYRDENGNYSSSLTYETASSTTEFIDSDPSNTSNVGPLVVYKPNTKVGSYMISATQSRDVIIDKPGTYARMYIFYAPSSIRHPEHTVAQFITNYSSTDDTAAIKKLDWKYLPEDTASQQWVLDNLSPNEQSDWEETDADDLSYIKNKPFGVLPIIDVYNEAVTSAQRQKLIDDTTSTKKFTDSGRTFIWIGDTFQTLSVVEDNVATIKYKNAEDKSIVTGKVYVAQTIDTSKKVFMSSDSSIQCTFVVIDKTDANNLRGVYLQVDPSSTLPTVSHIWSSVTYRATLSAGTVGWIGTKAEYEVARSGLVDGTKVFITDDESELISASLNGKPLTSSSTFYAPTTSGSAVQYLISQGENKAPVWQSTVVNLPVCAETCEISPTAKGYTTGQKILMSASGSNVTETYSKKISSATTKKLLIEGMAYIGLGSFSSGVVSGEYKIFTGFRGVDKSVDIECTMLHQPYFDNYAVPDKSAFCTGYFSTVIELSATDTALQPVVLVQPVTASNSQVYSVSLKYSAFILE